MLKAIRDFKNANIENPKKSIEKVLWYKEPSYSTQRKTEEMVLLDASFVGPLQLVLFGNNVMKNVTEIAPLGVK